MCNGFLYIYSHPQKQKEMAMNKTYKLKQKPETFTRLTGLSVEKFNLMYQELQTIYEKYNRNRLARNNRKRKIGGGGQFKLDLKDRLLMLLMYYRLYVTHAFLGFIFGIDDSNVCRNINPLQPLLAKIFKIPERKICMSEQEVVEVFIDATEQHINRPKRGQRKWYSGKKKRHTIKHQVIVTETGKIKGIGNSCYGKTHDKKD